jgi:uncharacterized protein YjaG (DUF416 family)
MLAFNKIELIQSLKLLSNRYRVAFAASCCERLVPNYDAFSIIEKWGNPQVLHDSLKRLWAYVEGFNLSEEEANSLIRSCEDVMPDTEDYYSIFTNLALNSTTAIIYTLRSSIETNIEELAIVGSLAVESVESYLSAVNDPNIGVHSADKSFDEWIEHAPMLIAELKKQNQDIEILNSWRGKDLDLIRVLQQSSRTIGIQPSARGFFK